MARRGIQTHRETPVQRANFEPEITARKLPEAVREPRSASCRFSFVKILIQKHTFPSERSELIAEVGKFQAKFAFNLFRVTNEITYSETLVTSFFKPTLCFIITV
jgi:hypothetical protein